MGDAVKVEIGIGAFGVIVILDVLGVAGIIDPLVIGIVVFDIGDTVAVIIRLGIKGVIERMVRIVDVGDRIVIIVG